MEDTYKKHRNKVEGLQRAILNQNENLESINPEIKQLKALNQKGKLSKLQKERLKYLLNLKTELQLKKDREKSK